MNMTSNRTGQEGNLASDTLYIGNHFYKKNYQFVLSGNGLREVIEVPLWTVRASVSYPQKYYTNSNALFFYYTLLCVYFSLTDR